MINKEKIMLLGHRRVDWKGMSKDSEEGRDF